MRCSRIHVHMENTTPVDNGVVNDDVLTCVNLFCPLGEEEDPGECSSHVGDRQC